MEYYKLANNLLSMREEGVSIWNSSKKSWKRWSFRVAAVAVAVYLYFITAQSELLLLGVGMILGAALQDIGWIWRIAKNWGFTEEVTNWEKVKKIAQNS